MTLSETVEFSSPLKLGSTDVAIIWESGAPDGDAGDEAEAAKGSLYVRTDATDDESPLYLKVDDDSSDDDWVQVFINKDESSSGKTLECYLEMTADAKVRFRSSSNYMYSPSTGVVLCTPGTGWRIGGGSDYANFGTDGTLTLVGDATVTAPSVMLPIITGGGTSTIEAFNGAPSINLDADTETFYGSFDAPNDWDAASDLTLVLMVANEIAEDDGDDVSIVAQVRGYADGDTTSDAGQSVACTLNLTGGDEAINVVNRVTGTIDYDDGTYDIAAGDTVIVECTVNLGGAGECTGPLHVLAWWVEYTANSLGG